MTYVGTLPDRQLAVALARWLRPAPDAWDDRPDTVTVTSARNAGRALAFRVELVLGTDELGAADGGARPAVRDRPPPWGGSGPGSVGHSGALGENPGEQRGGVTVRSASKPGWRLALVVLCSMLVPFAVACGGGDDGGGGGGGSTKKVDMAAELKKPATITVWAWTPGTEEA